MTGQFAPESEWAGTATTVQRSALDRRREKLQVNRAAAQAAIDAVADLDARLDNNSSLTRESEAALQAALDQVAALKKTIKATVKQKDQLESARKDARRAAARAQQRAVAAEAKYDRAVLAEIVRREKDHDLSVHSPAVPTGAAPSDAPLSATSTMAGEGDRPTLDTARATAARTTADRARAGTHLTSDAGLGSRASSSIPLQDSPREPQSLAVGNLADQDVAEQPQKRPETNARTGRTDTGPTDGAATPSSPTADAATPEAEEPDTAQENVSIQQRDDHE
jgi:hypothetical protein